MSEATTPPAAAEPPADARRTDDAAGVKRILIVRLSALGDVVHTLPVLHALRATFPAAEIGWAVDDRSSGLLEGNAELTRVHVLPRKAMRGMGWWGMWRTFKGFGRELRSFGYEIAVDVQSLAKSAYLAKASGARVIVGYARPEGREFSNWFHTVDVLPGNDVSHVVDRNLSLLTPLGVKRAPARFVFPDFADEYEALDPYFKVLGAPPAVLQPGTNWPNKRWPVEHFVELARLLVAERALPVAVAAHGDLELSWAEAIRRASGDRVSIAPPMGVRKLAAFMSRAAVVVGCDTGPVHLAWAQGVPTVALFGPTTGSRNGPIGGHARWVDAGLGCIGCWRDRCPDRTDACMRAITPERVFDLVQDVLAAR